MYTLRSDAEAPCRNHVKAYQFPVRAGQSASSPSRNARPSTPSPLRIVNQPQHTVMAAFAPPVHRDKFLYSSVLYADAGSDNHHPRASITELTALLRPEAPKAKKSKTSEITEPVRDPPWHFWTAQLIHYGLTATKDKNAAKIRLLGALNGGRLEVPAWILKLEVELKKNGRLRIGS